MAASINSRKRNTGNSTPNPRVTDPNDNKSAAEVKAEKLEAERIQLLSFMNRYREADAKCEQSAAAHKVNTDAKTEIARYAKAAIGVDRKQLDSYLADMKSSKRDLVREEETRRRHREVLGILTPEQIDMFADEVPADQRDAAYWGGEGYMAGMRMAPRTAPNGCDGDNLQLWLASYDSGAKVMADAIAKAQETEAGQRTADLENNAKGITSNDTPADPPETAPNGEAPSGDEKPLETVIPPVAANVEAF